MIHKLPPADVQTDLTALRDDILEAAKDVGSYESVAREQLEGWAKRLTDFLVLHEPENEEALANAAGHPYSRGSVTFDAAARHRLSSLPDGERLKDSVSERPKDSVVPMTWEALHAELMQLRDAFLRVSQEPARAAGRRAGSGGWWELSGYADVLTDAITRIGIHHQRTTKLDAQIERERKPKRCPTCDSPSRGLHPAVQSEGEVQICRDVWHGKLDALLGVASDHSKRLTPETEELRKLIAKWRKECPVQEVFKSSADDFWAGQCRGVNKCADELEDKQAALGSLPVPDTEDRLIALVAKWRERADVERGEMNEATDLETQSRAGAAWANIATCANELSALLSRSAQEPPKGYDVEATLQAACPDCGEFVGHRDGCIYEQPAVSRSRAPQEAINRLGEAPACEQHGAMVADDEFGRRWHCAVCEAVFSPAEAFGLRPEMQPIVDELLRRMSASPPAPAHPKRIQRQRTKGWHMPEGAIYVGRPTKWGNRFGAGHSRMSAQDRFDCVELFREWMKRCDAKGLVALDGLELLRGHDLACWCPLDQPCHADVLLEIANAELSREDAHQEEP